MKVIINIFKQNLTSMINGFRLPFSLMKFFQTQTNIEYVKISLNLSIGKFINMAVMFMPLKLLFVLKGAVDIEILKTLEGAIGRYYYIGLILLTIFLLYIANVVLQVYGAKLISRQLSNIEKKSYFFLDKQLAFKSIKVTYSPFCQVLANFLIIFMICLILLVIDAYFCVYFLCVFFVFSIIYEQWVFSAHETRLMKRLGIDKISFIKVMSMMMFLVLFIGLIFAVLTTDMDVIKAILLLLLVRLANESFKSYASSHMKLRKCYL